MKKKSLWNPINPYDDVSVEWFEEPPTSKVMVFEDHSKTIVTKNNSPDLPFTYSINPYRGCTHACSYCYARRTHEYLGYGAGSDFDTKIIVKKTIAELLDNHLRKPSWNGKTINMSGISDPYQPLEGRFKLARACLETCAKYNQPISVFTRSPLIRRDIDILSKLAKNNAVLVFLSIPIIDPELCLLLEPGTSKPKHRFTTIKLLADAGIPVGVSISPVIPGINDSMIPDILQQAKDQGATFSMMQLLRLPGTVATVFEHHIEQHLPLKKNKIMNALLRMRQGKLNNLDFKQRRTGVGAEWEILQSVYNLWTKKLGIQSPPILDEPSPYIPPRGKQISLF
jgi:DNA repair photolyase